MKHYIVDKKVGSGTCKLIEHIQTSWKCFPCPWWPRGKDVCTKTDTCKRFRYKWYIRNYISLSWVGDGNIHSSRELFLNQFLLDHSDNRSKHFFANMIGKTVCNSPHRSLLHWAKWCSWEISLEQFSIGVWATVAFVRNSP